MTFQFRPERWIGGNIKMHTQKGSSLKRILNHLCFNARKHCTYTLLLKTIMYKRQTQEKVKWHHRELGLFVLTAAALHLFITLLIILFMGGGCREGSTKSSYRKSSLGNKHDCCFTSNVNGS